jgi:NAD(P)-dependent dehydrogenase (short-subunit alcohol dehydrogenase family)
MSKTALVTGASRGIGSEVARELALEGYRVLLAVRKAEQAPKLANAVAEVLDVESPDSIDALAKRLTARGEALDVLVNNAGVYRGVNAQTLWHVNVRGPLLVTRALAPLLSEGARVVLVSSGLGRAADQDPALMARLKKTRTLSEMEQLCDDAPGDYGASKAALNRLAQLLADELEPNDVLVNAVSPGWCRTEMGGASAPRSVEQGAASVLWGCRLPADGPTGGFFEDGAPAE